MLCGDRNLPESTSMAPVVVTDRAMQCSILTFDDWFHNQRRQYLGEPSTCKGWFERNPHVELSFATPLKSAP